MVFLVHSAELNKPKWYISEGETTDDVTNSDCVVEAMGETLSDMLHSIQDSGDKTVYVVLSDITRKRVRRDKEYPTHNEIAIRFRKRGGISSIACYFDWIWCPF